MSIGITINVTDTVRPALTALANGLGDRSGLHEAIGRECLALTRDHLLHIAQTRHATAERLGAAPSGHWGQAAEKTTMRSDADAATITINQPGIRRAAQDVTIVPTGGKKWLTIPLVAEAYNQRAYRLQGLFFVKPKDGDHALLGRREGSGKAAAVTWLYLLKQSVFQKQDRTLLPPDEAYGQAALVGAASYVDYLLLRAGGRN